MRILPVVGLLVATMVVPVWAVPTPCTDVPSTEALVCRTAELSETIATVRPDLARAAAKLAAAATAVDGTCAKGNTRPTTRGLRRLRAPLADLRAEVARARSERSIPEVVGLPLEGLVRLTDMLRRATAARLAKHPCPELVTLLAPQPGQPRLPKTGYPSILVRAVLAPDADPDSLSVTGLPPGNGTSLSTSEAQLYGTLLCEQTGQAYELAVQVSNRAGTTMDREEAPYWCGRRDQVVGPQVDVLVDTDTDPSSLRLVPVRPLRSGATYAAVVTTELRGRRGRRVVASQALRSALALAATPTHGIEAFYAADPSDARNPFPSNRLRQTDGTIDVPDGFAARLLPADARLDGARAFLADLASRSEEHHGFSASAAIVFRFAEPVKLEKATPDRVFLVEVPDPDAALSSGDPAPLVARLRTTFDLEPDDIAALAIFTVEDLVGELTTIREQTFARAETSPPTIDFTDPNPDDTRRFGVYRPGDPGFASFFGGTPPASVGIVARGTFFSPDYRENGRIPRRFLDGSAVPPSAPIDVLIATPPEPAPNGGFPAVVLQHGFGGDNDFVTNNAADFTSAGLAVLGIPAPEHGPRGTSFLDFFVFDDFNAFGNNFRQATIDLLQLWRLLDIGIDLDGDEIPDVGGFRPRGYLGVSMGGVIGATFCSLENAYLDACVLNVPGGKLAQFAGSTSSLAVPFLARFAEQAGIPARTCGGAPNASGCNAPGDCDPPDGCLFNDDFVRMLDAALPDFQWQLDPGDGINYVGRRLEPQSFGPFLYAVLVQEGIGDSIVANPLTEALVRAAGLPVARADESPGGVSGSWRFPPPGGHGIFAQPEVRAQAITFLASGGRLIAPP